MTAVDIVQRQLDAYNARDLEQFVATYSETIRICRLPSCEPLVSSKRELAEPYATRVFNAPSLHAEILDRMVLGNKVIDHERVSSLRERRLLRLSLFTKWLKGLSNAFGS